MAAHLVCQLLNELLNLAYGASYVFDVAAMFWYRRDFICTLLGLHEGGYVFSSVRPFVCLSVCRQDYAKTSWLSAGAWAKEEPDPVKSRGLTSLSALLVLLDTQFE